MTELPQPARSESAPCPFCEIVAGRAPAAIVYEWAETIAFTPLDPVAPGHVLVVPHAHVTSAAADPAVMATTAYRASCLAGTHGLQANLITSIGPDATQTIRHLHLHIVPREPGDGLHLPWTPQHLEAPGRQGGD